MQRVPSHLIETFNARAATVPDMTPAFVGRLVRVPGDLIVKRWAAC